MKDFSKKIAVGLMLATVLTSAAACNKGGSDSGKEKVKLRFATWDNAEALDMQQKLVDEFNAQSDTIEVSLEAYGDNFDTKISAAMGGNDAPDLMYMWNYPKYGNGLEPLNSYIDKEGKDYKDNFYEALWNYNKIGDDILGIPIGYNTHVLYYNKDLFDQAGVEYPNDDWTWDDCKQAAEKITDESKKIYGLALPISPDPYDYEMYAWSNGGSFSDEQGNFEGYVNSPETVGAYKYFQDMLKEGSALATKDSGEENFKLGTIGMYINASWSIPVLKETNINYGLALLPDFGDKKSQSVINCSGISIAKDSKHKDEAWEFVKYWTGEELNKQRIGYELPVLKSVVSSEKLEEDENTAKFYAMLERSSEHMPSSFLIKNWADLSPELELAMEEMFNPNSFKDPQQALDTAVANVKK